MNDFAGLLVSAREKTGKTQAQVAAEAGLTPSYLSFIENRKKPPPSDAVCRRLAEVLSVPAKRLIEVAHLERAPETVRRRLASLSQTLKREKRSRKRLLERLLSPFLFAGPPGYLEGALERIEISPPRRRRIREALGALGRRRHEKADEVSRILEDLPERDRTALLEALPQLLGEEAERGRAREQQANEGTPPGTGEPELLYAPPLDEAPPPDPYLLALTADMDFPPELKVGDRVVVDPAVTPEAGDLIVVRAEPGVRIRRIERRPDGVSIAGSSAAGSDADHPAETWTPERVEAYLAAVALGTVVEVRRSLRRPASGPGTP